MQYSVSFPGGIVQYRFNASLAGIGEIVPHAKCIVITDSNIARLHGHQFGAFKAVITIPAGEEQKNFSTVLSVTQQLLQQEAHHNSFLLGIGGGMVTDITGFIASVYMRGISFGYVPTSLLGMVDASIGGKNGINIGLQKNLLGTITQPKLILFDSHFLGTLPDTEWANGFAEVIKYACLFDADMFDELSEHHIDYYRQNKTAVSNIITRCVNWKNKIVLADEQEYGIRKLLNFGHTAGHAFETVCNIPHGQAVALGMLAACRLSEQYGLDTSVTEKLTTLLQQYNLPVTIDADTDKLMQVLAMDKKRDGDGIDFVILKSLGKAEIKNIGFDHIRQALEQFTNAGNH